MLMKIYYYIISIIVLLLISHYQLWWSTMGFGLSPKSRTGYEPLRNKSLRSVRHILWVSVYLSVENQLTLTIIRLFGWRFAMSSSVKSVVSLFSVSFWLLVLFSSSVPLLLAI